MYWPNILSTYLLLSGFACQVYQDLSQHTWMSLPQKASLNHLSRKTYPHSFTTLYILCLFWSLHLSSYLIDHGARSKIFIIVHSNGDVLYDCTSYLLHKLHCLFLNAHQSLWGLCFLVISVCHNKHILQEFVVIMARIGLSEDPDYLQFSHETTLSFGI